MDKQAISDAVLVGRVLSSEAVLPRLEAFSGNALYYGRGIRAMDKYKTVKEVCDLTCHAHFTEKSAFVTGCTHSLRACVRKQCR